MTKKIEHLEKDNQEFKSAAAKTEELTKNLANARRQSVNLEKTLEEVNGERKALMKEKDVEINGLKEQVAGLRAKLSK